jgi:hypothetical protein
MRQPWSENKINYCFRSVTTRSRSEGGVGTLRPAAEQWISGDAAGGRSSGEKGLLN